MPYSPKVTLVPPFACPERSGWCCLRCLTRRGINLGSALLAGRVDGGLGLRHRVRPHRDLGSVGTWLGRGAAASPQVNPPAEPSADAAAIPAGPDPVTPTEATVDATGKEG